MGLKEWVDVAALVINLGVGLIALRMRADMAELKLWAYEKFEPKKG